MNTALVSNIRLQWQNKSDTELLEIWVSNDHSQWSEEAFEAAKSILFSRNIPLPDQNRAVPSVPADLKLTSGTFLNVKHSRRDQSDEPNRIFGVIKNILTQSVSGDVFVCDALFTTSGIFVFSYSNFQDQRMPRAAGAVAAAVGGIAAGFVFGMQESAAFKEKISKAIDAAAIIRDAQFGDSLESRKSREQSIYIPRAELEFIKCDDPHRTITFSTTDAQIFYFIYQPGSRNVLATLQGYADDEFLPNETVEIEYGIMWDGNSPQKIITALTEDSVGQDANIAPILEKASSDKTYIEVFCRLLNRLNDGVFNKIHERLPNLPHIFMDAVHKQLTSERATASHRQLFLTKGLIVGTPTGAALIVAALFWGNGGFAPIVGLGVIGVLGWTVAELYKCRRALRLARRFM